MIQDPRSDTITFSRPEFTLHETTPEQLDEMVVQTLQSQEFADFTEALKANSEDIYQHLDINGDDIRKIVGQLAIEVPRIFGRQGAELTELGIKANNPIAMLQLVKRIAVAYDYINYSKDLIAACLQDTNEEFDARRAHEYLRVSIGSSTDMHGNTVLIPQIVSTGLEQRPYRVSAVCGEMKNRFRTYLLISGFGKLTQFPVGYIEL